MSRDGRRGKVFSHVWLTRAALMQSISVLLMLLVFLLFAVFPLERSLRT